jgi:hypothetical protein
MIRNKFKIFTVKNSYHLANTQAGGQPLVGCPRLLNQYIRSYAPYLQAVSPSAT